MIEETPFEETKELSKSNKQSRCGYGASGNELSKMVLDEARNDDRIGNPQSQDINGNCPLRRKRGPYQITPDKIRKEVITRVVEGKETYKKVAEDLNLRPTTAASIVSTYKKEGRIEAIPHCERKKKPKISGETMEEEIPIKEETPRAENVGTAHIQDEKDFGLKKEHFLGNQEDHLMQQPSNIPTTLGTLDQQLKREGSNDYETSHNLRHPHHSHDSVPFMQNTASNLFSNLVPGYDAYGQSSGLTNLTVMPRLHIVDRERLNQQMWPQPMIQIQTQTQFQTQMWSQTMPIQFQDMRRVELLQCLGIYAGLIPFLSIHRF